MKVKQAAARTLYKSTATRVITNHGPQTGHLSCSLLLIRHTSHVRGGACSHVARGFRLQSASLISGHVEAHTGRGCLQAFCCGPALNHGQRQSRVMIATCKGTYNQTAPQSVLVIHLAGMSDLMSHS